MLIDKLILTNYRVYADRHEFDLAPRVRYGKSRPITLFGGLNGAGKTSILSGVRLALYGRAALGLRVSVKEYEEHLQESLHRGKGANRFAQSASVELVFKYAKLGIESSYHIVRSWELKKNKIKEYLRILENGDPIKGLNQEQAQNFLNELIPIGVSDLFFFDGEKIAQLADNTGGSVLEHSIKNLLGLDIVERLSGDLTVLNRQLVRSSVSAGIDSEINNQHQALEGARRNIEKIQQEISSKAAQIAEKRMLAEQIRKLLDDRGALFSTPRKELERELDNLNETRNSLAVQASSHLADAAPFTLAEEFANRTLAQINIDLESSRSTQESRVIEDAFAALVKSLTGEMSKEDLKLLKSQTGSVLKSITASKGLDVIIHDLTPSQAGNLFATYETAKKQSKQTTELFESIESTEQRIDEIIAALARAPDDAIIKDDFENFQRIQHQLGAHEAEMAALKSEAKALAFQALETAKKLDKLYDEASKTSDQQRVLNYIGNSNYLLAEFVTQTAEKKIKELEEQFTQCFARLARKDDLSLKISIDAKTYKVTLLAEDGRKIGKDEISAGEKQIFAISMLEALAKTSGRQLPMIVDTPLGRLDSKHRQKLIEGYFPKASHQMVILSTDTEVDESFYRELSPEISRAYKLEYSSKVGATSVEEGYFWQMRQAG